MLAWKKKEEEGAFNTVRWTESGLFLSYRNQSRSVGASSARKACVKNQAGGVALVRYTELSVCPSP